jgi:hypothetical protein
MRKLLLGIALVASVGVAGWWALTPPPPPAPPPRPREEPAMVVVPQANCGLTLLRGAALGVYKGALPGGGEVDLHVHRSRGVGASPTALANTPLVAFARVSLGNLGALFGQGEGPASSAVLCATTVGPDGEPRAGTLTEPDPAHRVAALTLFAPVDAQTAAAIAALGALDDGLRPVWRNSGAYLALELGEPGPAGDRSLITPYGRLIGPAVVRFVDATGHSRSVSVTLR